MKLEEALLEVLKDSPPNAALRKCDIEAAKVLMVPAPAPIPAAAPAAAPEAPAPAAGDAPAQA